MVPIMDQRAEKLPGWRFRDYLRQQEESSHVEILLKFCHQDSTGLFVRITGPLLSTGWTILGTTLPDFLPDSARPQFQTTRLIPDYRNHSSKVLGMALPDSRMRVWKTRPGDATPQTKPEHH